ncbi:MAG TPA: MOSC N-terminal beta barrel domain-containing protein [Burkholderiaceae bacterium]
MPTLTSLTIYPIKSCAGIALEQAEVTSLGLAGGGVRDREWMVVDVDGNLLTQREIPVMALVVPRVARATLAVDAPGMSTLHIPIALGALAQAQTQDVRVWDDFVLAYDCGSEAAAWFSRFLDTACRLVRFHPQARRLASSKWTAGREVPTLFSDGFPMLVTSVASLADLNQRLLAQGRAALPMNRFRPNLVIDGVEAFEEDYAATIRIGAACLQPVKPCARCPMPSVDQATGKFGPDPLDILQTYRANPLVDGGITFGMNAILIDGENSMLQVGQEALIELAF